MERKCYTCKETKPIDEFCKTKKEKSKYAFQCKECKRRENIVYRYGLSIESYYKLLTDQEYKCAICGIEEILLTKRLYIDHCHTTGKVRGLLCTNCNTALGLLKENKENLKNMILYIDKHTN